MFHLNGIFYCLDFVLIIYCNFILLLLVEILDLTLHSPLVIVLTLIASNWCYAIAKIQVKNIQNSQVLCS